MEVWNNSASMNLPHVLHVNILGLPYFKRLTRLRTYHEVLHEIDSEVHYLEPWVPGTQVPSTAMCLMYKLFTLKLTENQATDMLDNSTEAFIRAIAILYLRCTCPPPKMWDWFYAYIDDPQQVQITKSGTRMTIGELTRELISEQKFCNVILPRIPAKEKQRMMKEIEEWDASQGKSGPPGAVSKPKGATGSKHRDDRGRGSSRTSSRESGGRGSRDRDDRSTYRRGSRDADRRGSARRDDRYDRDGGRARDYERREYGSRRPDDRDYERDREEGRRRGSREDHYRGSERARGDYDRARHGSDSRRDRGDVRGEYRDGGRDRHHHDEGHRSAHRGGSREREGERERERERRRDRYEDRNGSGNGERYLRKRSRSHSRSPPHPRAQRRRTRSPSPRGLSPAHGSPAPHGSPAVRSPGLSPSSHASPQRKKDMGKILAQYGSSSGSSDAAPRIGDDSLGGDKIMLGFR